MKRFYGLTGFHGCILSWLTTLNLGRENDRSFEIYYHNFPIDIYLKHFINAYRCVFLNLKVCQLTDLTDSISAPGILHFFDLVWGNIRCYSIKGFGALCIRL